MGKISFHKVNSMPVAPYAADAVYFYKTGAGFQLLVTDSAGGEIYGLSAPSASSTSSLESADLRAIAGLTGPVGLLRKTAAGTWTLDTSSYLTGIASSQVTTALGYTPVNPDTRGVANGIATLDAGGKVPAGQLPSFVDDVVDVANFAALPATGEAGKIYILGTPHTVGAHTSSQFRWSGSAYAPIVSSPGTTDVVPEGSSNLYFTAERARAAVDSITGNAATASKLITKDSYGRETNAGTLVAGTRYSIYTGSGPVTMALPTFANTTKGDEIEIANMQQTWEANNFTVTCPAGVKINTLTESLVCDYNAGGFTFVCVEKDANSAFWTVRT